MTIQRSTTAPTGFINSLLMTTTSADASLGATQLCWVGQKIEGLNVADLGWGTASAATVTLSFWVRSSLTGTFGGSLANAAFNRSYPFTYTINSANTFEYKTITIAGDTTGTWPTDLNSSFQLLFGLGVGSTYSGTAGAWAGTGYISATGATSVIGTNGATFYITGVQLERGSTASSFEYRSFGTELALCQRYFQKSYDQATALGTVATTGEIRWVSVSTAGEAGPTIMLPVTMRTTPTITFYSPNNGASGFAYNYSSSTNTATSGHFGSGPRGWSGTGVSFTAGHIVGYQFIAAAEL
jgi:hypothetical protein